MINIIEFIEKILKAPVMNIIAIAILAIVLTMCYVVIRLTKYFIL